MKMKASFLQRLRYVALERLLPGTKFDRLAGRQSQAIQAVAMALSDDQDVKQIRRRLDHLIKRYGEAIWVYVSVSKVAQSAAGIPWRVVRVNNAGDEEPVTSGRLYDRMQQPNPQQSIYDFIESHQSSMELAGESFIELDRGVTGTGQVQGMYVLPIFDEHTMRVIRDPGVKGSPDGPVRGYIYTVQGKQVPFLTSEIIHVKYYNPFDPFRGFPPLRAAALAVDSDVKSHEYNHMFFSNSAVPSGHFESEDQITESQWKRFVRLIQARHQGHKKSHRPLLLRGVKWKQTQLNPKDAELVNLMKLSRSEIIAAYGVTPVVAGILEKNPQANAEVQERAFWKGAIVPKTKKTEDKLNVELAPLFDGGRLRIRRDFSAVPSMQEDFSRKLNDALKLQKLGYPANDINRRLDLGMDELPWGNTVLVNPLLVPVEAVVNGAVSDERTVLARLVHFMDDVEREQIHIAKPAIAILPERSLEDQKRTALERFELRQARAEETVTAKLVDFFEAQRRRIQRNLKSEGAVRQIEEYPGGSRDFAGFDMSIIFNEPEELDAFRELSREDLRETLLQSMLSFIADHSLSETDFDLTSDAILDYLEQESFRQAKNVTATTRARLAEELKEALDAGESIAQIGARIDAAFRDRASSAETIARTETVSSLNFGSWQGALQAGVKSRSWISSRDLRVRDAHREIDFKTSANPIPIGSNYTLSDGSVLRHPGDGSLGAAAEQVVQCRCTELYHF